MLDQLKQIIQQSHELSRMGDTEEALALLELLLGT
jgi:hypothetical protein